jgi:hypothetical protein
MGWTIRIALLSQDAGVETRAAHESPPNTCVHRHLAVPHCRERCSNGLEGRSRSTLPAGEGQWFDKPDAAFAQERELRQSRSANAAVVRRAMLA